MKDKSGKVILESVCRYYDGKSIRTHALRDINLSVNSGEFIAITGPSGCGKSTLLNVVGLLDVPNSGTISYFEDRINIKLKAQLRRTRLRYNGYIFQSFNLLPDETVFNNVALPLKYRGLKKQEILDKTRQAIDSVGLLGRIEHYPSQLSGGQQQRVAIARALALEPKILFADEPTGNLDTENSRAVMEALKNFNVSGTTIFMVSHSLEDIKYADRVVSMVDGTIASDEQ